MTGLNFGGAGTLVVAPAASVKGEFQSVIKFNLSNAVALFNTNYGAGNWTITDISLELTSNYGTGNVQPNNAIFPVINGGNFVIEWLSNDDWVEGTGTPNLPTTDGVTYDSLPDLLSGAHEILCTNTYSPPGNNVPVTYALAAHYKPRGRCVGRRRRDVSFLRRRRPDWIPVQLLQLRTRQRAADSCHRHLNAVRLKILSGYFTNGLFHLTGIGETNLQYQVQANSDLTTTNWQTIGTATADSTGMIQFDDPTVTNQPQRFYRLSR